MLARAHKKFQRGGHSEIYLLTLKKQDKTKMELPLDMVSISASSCRTTVYNSNRLVASLAVPESGASSSGGPKSLSAESGPANLESDGDTLYKTRYQNDFKIYKIRLLELYWMQAMM